MPVRYRCLDPLIGRGLRSARERHLAPHKSPVTNANAAATSPIQDVRTIRRRHVPRRDLRKEHIMKYSTPLVAVALAAACGAALASEYGTVISSTPVTAQLAVPQQQCTDQPVLVQPRTSGGGALLGALVGGVVGHSLGEGFGRAAATGLGAVAGSVIGDRTEAATTPPTSTTVLNCQNVTTLQNRVVGYDVVYEFNGQRYTARVAQDPGERIALTVSPAPAGGTVAIPPPSSYGYYDQGGPAVMVEPRLVIGGYRRHGY